MNIRMFIKIYQIFQTKRNSDAIREKSINGQKKDTEENIIAFLNQNSQHEDGNIYGALLPGSINIVRN